MGSMILPKVQCATFYAETMGRPGLSPGIYFRLLLIGYFEGIDSERGIAWRATDSFPAQRGITKHSRPRKPIPDSCGYLGPM